MSSGHQWNDDKCDLCGDKDWYADRYCAGNPKVAVRREKWLESLRVEPHEQALAAKPPEEANNDVNS